MQNYNYICWCAVHQHLPTLTNQTNINTSSVCCMLTWLFVVQHTKHDSNMFALPLLSNGGPNSTRRTRKQHQQTTNQHVTLQWRKHESSSLQTCHNRNKQQYINVMCIDMHDIVYYGETARSCLGAHLQSPGVCHPSNYEHLRGAPLSCNTTTQQLPDSAFKALMRYVGPCPSTHPIVWRPHPAIRSLPRLVPFPKKRKGAQWVPCRKNETHVLMDCACVWRMYMIQTDFHVVTSFAIQASIILNLCRPGQLGGRKESSTSHPVSSKIASDTKSAAAYISPRASFQNMWQARAIAIAMGAWQTHMHLQLKFQFSLTERMSGVLGACQHYFLCTWRGWEEARNTD